MRSHRPTFALAAAAAALLILTTPAIASSKRVAPWGSDSNPGTAAAPWATIGKASAAAAAGETVYVESGSYAQFPNPAQERVTFVGLLDVRGPGGRLARPRTTVRGFNWWSDVSVWGNGCALEWCTVRGGSFNLDNWAGVDDVKLRDLRVDVRNPGSTAFLLRWQPEGDARIRRLVVERCRFVCTVLPGQPVDQKVVMMNRLEDCVFADSWWTLRDSTGQDPGSSVRQGYLCRDGLKRNRWVRDTIEALALVGGRGNIGIDFTSSGNTIAGGGNIIEQCLIRNETGAYTQHQWKMQDGDQFRSNRVETRTGYRISGIDGVAFVLGNQFHALGSAPALIIGGSGNWSGTLYVLSNRLSGSSPVKHGITYEPGDPSAVVSDGNGYMCTRGQEVQIAGTWTNLATACARGWDCRSISMATKQVIP